MSTTRIPLFPLEVVLLPESVLPLHIFEPRYREMTRHCIENSAEFGVVRQREHGVVAVGCTAEITQTLKEYEDGRFDLLTIGRQGASAFAGLPQQFRMLHLLRRSAPESTTWK